jgi:predicted P-loop ATPase
VSYGYGSCLPRFMSDDDFVDLRLEIQEKFRFLPSKDYFIDVVKNIARSNKFHPVRERFDALQWDGEARIDEFFITYAGAEDTELNRAISRKFFMAGIKRIYQPGCKFDTMLVIEGEQGTGKSTLFKLLAMEEEFFSDDFPLGGDAKQTIEQTRGKFLIECAELKGMRASDVTKVKSQLSRTRRRRCSDLS